MRFALLVLVLLVPTLAAADTAGDVTKAFTAFVDGVAAKQPVPDSVDTFLTPYLADEPVPKDLAPVRALIGKTKVAVTKVVISKSGTSAWLYGQIPVKSSTVRVSAVLVLGKVGWQVTATHWSVGVPNEVQEMCGALKYVFYVEPGVADSLKPTLKPILDALGGSDHGRFLKLLSDDKNAFAIGSAGDESFEGGSTIKSVFKKLAITYEGAARAGITSDGTLMWLVVGMTSPIRLCTIYRTLYVLQKEKAGWRIVHHHYSEPIAENTH